MLIAGRLPPYNRESALILIDKNGPIDWVSNGGKGGEGGSATCVTAKIPGGMRKRLLSLHFALTAQCLTDIKTF